MRKHWSSSRRKLKQRHVRQQLAGRLVWRKGLHPEKIARDARRGFAGWVRYLDRALNPSAEEVTNWANTLGLCAAEGESDSELRKRVRDAFTPRNGSGTTWSELAWIVGDPDKHPLAFHPDWPAVYWAMVFVENLHKPKRGARRCA